MLTAHTIILRSTVLGVRGEAHVLLRLKVSITTRACRDVQDRTSGKCKVTNGERVLQPNQAMIQPDSLRYFVSDVNLFE